MIHFNKYGTSENTIIFLHGLCENNEIWKHEVSEFSGNYSILAFDLPGFGKSKIDKFVSISEMAEQIHTEIRELNINKPIIVGHSMGGYVALAYAKLFPEDLKGLVLYHSSAYADNDEKKEKRKKQIQSIVKNGKIPFLKELYGGLFSDDFKNETAKQKVWDLLNHAQENGIVNALEAMMKRDDNTAVIQNNLFPILLLAGEKDKIIPIDSQKELEKLSPNCELKTLKNSGHMGMVEEPKESLEILKNFFEEISNN